VFAFAKAPNDLEPIEIAGFVQAIAGPIEELVEVPRWSAGLDAGRDDHALVE
jgi:hypothetical protein